MAKSQSPKQQFASYLEKLRKARSHALKTAAALDDASAIATPLFASVSIDGEDTDDFANDLREMVANAGSASESLKRMAASMGRTIKVLESATAYAVRRKDA